jgi:uncharacterized RDD family membrane protein YckC
MAHKGGGRSRRGRAPRWADRSADLEPLPIRHAVLVLMSLVFVVYETIATARYGRTFGKAWLHNRPLCRDGTSLSWGRSFGRAAIYRFGGLLGVLSVLDQLWCLWDDNRQCLHDKVVGTIVVNDPARRDPDAPTGDAAQ